MKEPRMPLIIEDNDLQKWLSGSEIEIQELIQPNDSVELEFYTVRPLSGKLYVGNNEKVIEKYHYPELDEPLTLF